MAKLGQALGQLRAVGASLSVYAHVETVADVHQLAEMAGAAVEHQWMAGGRVLESFSVDVDGHRVTVQASRPPVPSDFDALNPVVRA